MGIKSKKPTFPSTNMLPEILFLSLVVKAAFGLTVLTTLHALTSSK
jgi:hypothetical protein